MREKKSEGEETGWVEGGTVKIVTEGRGQEEESVDRWRREERRGQRTEGKGDRQREGEIKVKERKGY